MNLVVDQIVQSNHRSNHARQVDNKRLIVRLDVRRLDKLGHGNLGQEIENILEMIDDLMVDGQLAFDHLVHVDLDVVEARVEALETVELIRQLLTQTAHGDVANVAEQMLHAHFFGLFGADLRRQVLECLRCGRSVL